MGIYTLRQATDNDYDFLYILNSATLKDYVLQTWGKWDEEWQSARFRANFDPSEYQIIVVNGHDVGEIILVERETDLYIASVEILPECQGRGIGTAVIKDILAQADRAGLAVALQVLKVNPARRLYERLGFAVIGETETHYLMRSRPDRE
jgi:ribosomal protein S18 acetylase RimI-like enzyme